MISSLDGKISTGDVNELVDLNFKRIKGIKEGLRLIYDVDNEPCVA